MSSRRRVAAALGSATLTAGAVVVSVGSPAEAAPPSTAVVCFAFPNGAPYTGPVRAQSLDPRGWRTLPPTSSNTGCTLWTLETGTQWRFVAYAAGFRWAVEGASDWMPMPYPGRYDAGTWMVEDRWF